MNNATLFSAYRQCRTAMESLAVARGSRQGIAVHDDNRAIQWQRYERLARKIERRLLPSKIKIKNCPICGYHSCSSRCPRHLRVSKPEKQVTKQLNKYAANVVREVFLKLI
jgi:hypothetical protein